MHRISARLLTNEQTDTSQGLWLYHRVCEIFFKNIETQTRLGFMAMTSTLGCCLYTGSDLSSRVNSYLQLSVSGKT